MSPEFDTTVRLALYRDFVRTRIFEPLEQCVCRRVVEANVCPFVGKQIGSFLFGILSQRLPSLICVRPVSAQYVVESEDLRR